MEPWVFRLMEAAAPLANCVLLIVKIVN